MTDNTDALDELVSRYLDAEATADEVARVESDPALLARADELRAAIEAVAAPVDVPELDLDRIRVAAIEAAGPVVAAADTVPVADLSAARARKLERRNRFMAVAAAFVFLALGFAAVQNLGSGGDDDETTEAATDSADDGDDAAAEDSGADDAFEAFADESDDDMAEEADMAMAETEMADDDMADEAMAEEEAEDLAAGDDAATERLGVDVLPDELAPVATLDELLVVIDEAYADVVDVPFLGEPFDGICIEAVQLIADRQDDRTVSVETAVVMVGDELLTVLVAFDFANDRMVLTHPVDDCAASSVISPELP